MTVSNTTTQTSLTAAGGTDFAFTFSYIDQDQISVYADGVLQSSGYTITDGSTTSTSPSYNGGTVVFSVAPTSGTVILIKRETDLTQPEDFEDTDPVPQETFEEMGDRLLQQIQELDRAIDAIQDDSNYYLFPPSGVTENKTLPDMTDKDQYIVVVDESEENFEYINASASDIANNKSNIDNLLARMTTVEDDLDDAETDIDDLESQQTTNTAQIGTNTGNISTLSTQQSTNTTNIASNTTRVSAIENLLGDSGSQTILNAQAVGVQITDWVFNGTDYHYIKIEYLLERTAGANEETEVGAIHLIFKNGSWQTELGMKYFDIAGVTFSVATEAGGDSTVTYTSDTLAGGSHSGKITYRIIKYGVSI